MGEQLHNLGVDKLCPNRLYHIKHFTNLGSLTLLVAELWCIEAVNILASYHNCIYLKKRSEAKNICTDSDSLPTHYSIIMQLVKIETAIHACQCFKLFNSSQHQTTRTTYTVLFQH